MAETAPRGLVLVRRWYIVVIGLIATLALALGAMAVAPQHYSARGLVMLLPSRDLLGARGNPLLNLGGLDLPARVLVAYYASEPAQAAMADNAPGVDVAVTIEQSTGGPIIAVDVQGNDPASVLDGLEYVVGTIPQNLERIQDSVGATGTAAIQSIPLVVDDQAQQDHGSAVRLVVATIAVGLVLTLVVTFGADGVILRREQPLEPEPAPDPDDLDIEAAPS